MKKVSEADKREARKVGKLPKAPRKPKQSASVGQLEAYKVRWDAYADRVQEMAKAARKRDQLKKEIFGR